MDQLKKYKKQILIGAATLGAIGLIYNLLKPKAPLEEEEEIEDNNNKQPGAQKEENKSDNQNKKENPQELKPVTQNNNSISNAQEQKQDSASNFQLDEKKIAVLDLIKKNAKLSYVKLPDTDYEILDFKSIFQISEFSIELCSADYVKATIDNRALRRKLMNTSGIDSQEYLDQVYKYNDDVQQILINSEMKVLEHLNIPKNLYEESTITLMEKGYHEQIMMLHAQFKQRMKEKIPSQKGDLSLKEVKDIIRYQAEILKSKPQVFEKIIAKAKNNIEEAQLVPEFIVTILSDYVYVKFQVEEEDQARVFMKQQFMADQEIHQLFGEIERVMMGYMQQFQMGGMGGMGGMDQNQPYFG